VRVERWSADEAVARTMSPDLRHQIGVANGVVGVYVDAANMAAEHSILVAQRIAACGALTVATSDQPAANSPWDLVIDDPSDAIQAMLAHPATACVAAQLLRRPHPDRSAARLAESLAYATLQAGPDYRNWLESRGSRVRTDNTPRVALDDYGDTVRLTLTRGRLHNLLDRQMRDELAEAFITIAADQQPRLVIWTAEGPTFCAGGDPAEFGSAPDPLQGHLVRTVADLAPLLDPLAERMRVEIDGPCVGAGIELAAICHSIVATPRSTFRLPEISMGLIPGAGGTVSIPLRIGRHRSLEWLLTGATLDAVTALGWGLIDEISQ